MNKSNMYVFPLESFSMCDNYAQAHAPHRIHDKNSNWTRECSGFELLCIQHSADIFKLKAAKAANRTQCRLCAKKKYCKMNAKSTFTTNGIEFFFCTHCSKNRRTKKQDRCIFERYYTLTAFYSLPILHTSSNMHTAATTVTHKWLGFYL